MPLIPDTLPDFRLLLMRCSPENMLFEWGITHPRGNLYLLAPALQLIMSTTTILMLKNMPPHPTSWEARALSRWFALQRQEFSRWTRRRTRSARQLRTFLPRGEICVAVIAWIIWNLKIWAEKSTRSEMLEKSIGREIDVLPDISKSG